ncbi:DsrE/DsrF/DrsH-like family protein [Clostridium sp. 19966]|uniref:DsrE/DsrF/DrsH-like family protein n=1 Tax=Clostridium sp. 19966 TaxID=2768166 RepID=UPI0028E06027|nr:DsrE/DsrF/DrsH-like family protein [Clostridium sp. 19966]MDT8716279.1 DsrE/DsrF/DrsH-like family protein [Clostridium sp. 19966]
MNKKVLIIGGVAGGASAAARLRRLDEFIDIVMFEKGNYISFANCGLPYYIGDTIKERDRLLIQTPEKMKNRFNIDVRINSEVMGIDSTNKTVKVNSKDKGMYEESYDYVILAPGAKAIVPNIPGINNPKILTLRNIGDMDKIKNEIDLSIKNAVVIGGGYVGVEMAENLAEKNINVTLVEAAPHILAPFDTDISIVAEKELNENGVNLILGDGVENFIEKDSSIEIGLNSGKKILGDMVILAIGVTPDTKFIRTSGINTGKRGHILVNEKLETNIEGIYAVGDAIEIIDFVNKENAAIPLAGPANKQGRIAADNIVGLNSKYNGTQGTSIIKIFDLTAASTGNNERTLKRLNIPYKTVTIHPASHATYYPDSYPMTLKLIFDNEGKILGAQGIGHDGVDKRIDVIATALRLNGTIYDLTELELAYAPPFSSAKDPVNMAGYAAENILNGSISSISVEEFKSYDKDNVIILDVRTNIEFNNGHIEGAINIPVDELRDRMKELDKGKEILEYCQVGLRGYIASRILIQNGFKVKNISGGYKSFLSQKFVPSKDFRNKEENMKLKNNEAENGKYDKTIDACGLCCPGPILQVKSTIDEIKENEVLKVNASDPGFYEDIKAWCRKTNNELLDIKKVNGKITAFIKKNVTDEAAFTSLNIQQNKENKTMVVFSGDLDKAIASFIIANGAAAMGKKVTMFFTFWGLNILRKSEKTNVKKNFIETMFGYMMPKGSEKLKLSKMSMMGVGGKLIRKIMKDKNISSLEELIKTAIDNGVEIVACSMSMDVMGLKKEELIDGVKIGGVGYYLGEAEDSNVNLFI